MYDVIVVGAGVIGCAIARELSRYPYKIAVLERASDVCEGTSKANSGIVHSGYDAEPGSLKARMNLMGNAMIEKLAKELEIPFQRNGSMVLLLDEDGRPNLEALYRKGIANGVEGLCILTAEEVQKREPHVTKEAVAALYAPTAGIICPFTLTIALAENACTNGAEFCLDTEVLAITKVETVSGEPPYYRLDTTKGSFESMLVINAAGVYADTIHNMVCQDKIHLTPRRGEYCLMDKTEGDLVHSIIFQLPSKMGKGILVTPTVHGNLLVGPTAEDVDDKESTNTTAAGLAKTLDLAKRSVATLSASKIITSFAGLRAHHESGDFIIEESKEASGFIDVAGIESPGLTSAPAIAVYVTDLVQGILPKEAKKEFVEKRSKLPNMAEATEEERKNLIAQNPAYAHVVCRCELVTEGEILEAIHRSPGAVTLDGIKRRTRAGMGRCQAGFCAPYTLEILARELQQDVAQITKAGGDSVFLTGIAKEVPSGNE